MSSGRTTDFTTSFSQGIWRQAVDNLRQLIDHSRQPISGREQFAMRQLLGHRNVPDAHSIEHVRLTVNVFRARALLRLAFGQDTWPIESEYHGIVLSLSRILQRDTDVVLTLAQIYDKDLDDIVDVAVQLLDLMQVPQPA